MFTGIVEEIGQIKAVQRNVESVRLTIAATKVLNDVKLGDSIAVNGVCLTVTEFTPTSFVADVMPETMKRSNLGSLALGARVNLERALKLSDRLGGHIVSGHIDGMGQIVGKKQDDNAIWIHIGAPPQILKYIIEKGSVAIDGISLTVAYVDDSSFKVSIIPHTQDETTLVSLKEGTRVNLENDLTAKYIEKFLFFKDEEKKNEKSSLTMNLLEENGFL
jgi:riboflavin synthase